MAGIHMNVGAYTGFTGIKYMGMRAFFAFFVTGMGFTMADLITHFTDSIVIRVGIYLLICFVHCNDAVISVDDNKRPLMTVDHGLQLNGRYRITYISHKLYPLWYSHPVI
jgi:hypothetical protein